MKRPISVMPDWKDNYLRTREAVTRACDVAGRSPAEVQLLAVSKFQPAEALAAVASVGQLIFGENYVQEWQAKRERVAAILPGVNICWHMTGHVQQRKAGIVAGAFALLHTLDSRKLADALERHLVAQNLLQPVLLEINIGGEQQKAGILPENALPLARHVLARCPHLPLRGLMCIPPLTASGAAARPFFARLRRLRDDLEGELGCKLPELSMGMSADFGEAIMEGATIVRIGTSIFGPRPPQPPV